MLSTYHDLRCYFHPPILFSNLSIFVRTMDGGNYEYDLSSKNKAIDHGLIYNNDKVYVTQFCAVEKKANKTLALILFIALP